MALQDFNGLKNSIQEHSAREDVSEKLEDAIYLAEKRMEASRLRIRENENRATTTLKKDDRFCPLPLGFISMRSLRVYSGGRPHDLYYVTDEAMKIKEPGMPVYYTIGGVIELDRIPDANYQLEMKYYKEIPYLSKDNPTNAILQKYPDLYLFGGLAAIYRAVRDEHTAMYYDQLFMESIAQANKRERSGRFGTAPAMRTERVTP